MKYKEKNFVSVVIYLRNNADIVQEFLENLCAIFHDLFERYEVICVDDASDDDSVEVIRNTASGMDKITLTVLEMSYFHGLELAMDAGNNLAIGDFIYEFDSCQRDYELEMVERIYRYCLKGYDIVAAAPDQKIKLSSSIFYKVFKRFSVQKIDMRTERFRILSRRAVNRIRMMNQTVLYRKILYMNCGLRSLCVPYQVQGKIGANHKEKQERGYRLNLAVDSLILFTQAGYRIVSRLTICMMAIAMICAIYTAGIFLSGHAIVGWTTTMLFLTFAFSGLFGILTIVIKYLSILVNLVFCKKKYSYENIEKISR